MDKSNEYVVAIGGSNIDIIGQPYEKLLFKNSNKSKINLSSGGVIRNIAENLSKLNSKCHLITVFGNDDFGSFLKNNLKHSLVKVNHSLTIKSAKTSTYMSVNDSNGEMVVALNDTKIIDHLTPEFLKTKEKTINNSRAIVIDANLNEEVLAYIFSNFKKKYIFADPVSVSKCEKLKKYLKNINVLKPNLEEAKFLFNLKQNSKDYLSEISSSLSKLHIEKLIISLGDKGIISYNNGEIKNIPTIKQDIINVNGAGDALMAGLIHGYMKNWEWDYTIKFCISMASIALQTNDTVNPNLTEKKVLNFLNENILK